MSRPEIVIYIDGKPAEPIDLREALEALSEALYDPIAALLWPERLEAEVRDATARTTRLVDSHGNEWTQQTGPAAASP